MTGRAGSTTGGSRSTGRRAGGGEAIDLDEARARADRAVARAARPRSSPAGKPRAAAKPTSGAKPTRGATPRAAAKPASGAEARAAAKTTTGGKGRPAAAKPTPARRTAATRTGTPVNVVSSTPRRPPPSSPRRRRDPANVRGLSHGAAGAIAHYFGHTPATRHRVLADKVTRARSTRRLTATAAVLILVFSVVVVRLVDLQVLNPAAYAKTEQRTYHEDLPADRGSIVDRTGLPLAITAPATSLFVDGKFMAGVGSDPHADAVLLASMLEAEPAKATERAADIEAKMRDAERQFTYVARQVSPDVVEKVKDAKQQKDPTDPQGKRRLLTGVGFLDEPKRFRASGEVARSLVGDVSIEGLGISGIERRYAEDLTGQPGHIVIERSPAGRTIAPAEPKIEPAVKGRDVQLTIDRSVQFEAEQILSDQVRAVGGASGVAIVAKPDTGELLAMANVVAERQGDEVTDVHVSSRNAAVIDTYEPGSVMKLVTAAGALEEKVVTPDTTLPAGPNIKVCNANFGEAEPSHALTKPSTVSEIIAKSSNVGTIQMAQKLGRDALYKYLRAFGFGTRTAVDFPDELAGSVPRPDHPDEWWCSSDGSVPIGQGVAVTPLQMLAAYNTIANGGVYVPPRLLGATIDPDGTRHPVASEPGRRVVSAETANQLNIILRGVVEEGTGTAAAIAGYTPAGKTGTARQASGGGYQAEDGRTHYDATFAGFVPAEAPALSILVLVRDPAKPGNIYGGTAAAPAFARIGAGALRHFDVPPPSTDLALGGAAVAPESSDPTRPGPGATAPGTGLERTADGRVRVRPAGLTTTTAPPATTAPGRRTGTSTTRSTAAPRAASAGVTTTGARR
jgi:cell division protein FtsI (penicillin-binding protein 3)